MYDKSGNYRAYVSDYGVCGAPTLTDISRISTKVHADFSKWVSQTRLINWANRHGMHFTRWRQQARRHLGGDGMKINAEAIVSRWELTKQDTGHPAYIIAKAMIDHDIPSPSPWT